MRLPLIAWATLLVLAGGACGSGGPRPSPSPPGAPGERVTFAAADGAELRGRIFEGGSGGEPPREPEESSTHSGGPPERTGGRAGVVLAHMFPSDATSWFGTARKLADSGYAALAFDFRYRTSGRTDDAAKADSDVRAAYEFLKGKGAEKVALVGASMGGTAALIAASQVPTAAVIAISAPTQFRGLDAEASAPNVSAPVLLLASSGDDEAARSLRTLSGILPNDVAKLYDGDAHGTSLLTARPSSEEEVLRFLATHLPPPPG